MPRRGQFKWGNVETLEAKINEYFDNLDSDGDVPSQVGLSLWLDISIETLQFYASGRYQEWLSRKTKNRMEEQRADEDPIDTEESKAGHDLFGENEIITDDEIDNIKMRVSATFKKATKRIEAWWIKTGSTSKNPFPMYYLKAYCGRFDVPMEADKDKPQILEVRLVIQPPEQPKPLQGVQELPNRTPQIEEKPPIRGKRNKQEDC